MGYLTGWLLLKNDKFKLGQIVAFYMVKSAVVIVSSYKNMQ